MVAPLLATTVAHGAPSRSHQKHLARKKKCPNRAFQKKSAQQQQQHWCTTAAAAAVASAAEQLLLPPGTATRRSGGLPRVLLRCLAPMRGALCAQHVCCFSGGEACRVGGRRSSVAQTTRHPCILAGKHGHASQAGGQKNKSLVTPPPATSANRNKESSFPRAVSSRRSSRGDNVRGRPDRRGRVRATLRTRGVLILAKQNKYCRVTRTAHPAPSGACWGPPHLAIRSSLFPRA